MTAVLMLTTAVAPTLNKAIEDGDWPFIPDVADGANGADEWTPSEPPEGTPILPGHEYDAAIAISRTPTTWVLDSNVTRNVSIEMLIVNSYGGPVRGMMLELFLTSNVTLLSSSIPPSRNGDYMLWPVGTMAVGDTYSLTLDLEVTTASANFTAADDGLLVYGHRGTKAIYTFSQSMRFVNRNLSEYLKSTVDANWYDLYVKNTGSGIGGDVSSIYEYVRDFIAYEAYVGSLRGARGTLWGMAGNSLDQSNLLVALLRGAGIPCRYVVGNLSVANARTLVMSMFVSGENVTGNWPDGEPLADPATNMTLINEARNHTWVEYYVGQDKWVSLDPSFSSAEVNDTFTVPADRFSETPEHWRHHVRIKVRVEEWELFGAMEGRLNMKTVFNYVYPTAKLVGQNSYFTHEVTKKPHGREFLPFGGINPYYYETITYQDILVIANETTYGNTYVETFYPTSAYELLSEEFLGEWIDIEMTSPTGKTVSTTREIFDKVGYEYRRSDGSCYLGEPMMERDPPISGAEVYSIFVAPNRVPLYAVENQVDQFQASYQAYKDAAKNDTTKADKEILNLAVKQKHVDLLHLAAMQMAHVSDMRDNTAQVILQIKSYYIEPRIVIASFESKDPEFYFILDWRYNDIRGMAVPGTSHFTAWKYQEQKGITDTDVESELMEVYAPNQTVISLVTILDKAREEGVPLVYLTKDWDFMVADLNISAAAKKRIQHALDDGKVVVVPQRSVMMANKSRIAWWEQDLTTGKVYSVGERGLHFSLTGIMVCLAIIGILQSIVTTIIGVGGSMEAAQDAMNLFADAVLAVVDWMVGPSYGTPAEYKAWFNSIRQKTADWIAAAYKAILISLELVASGISDIAGSVAGSSAIASAIEGLFKGFGKDVVAWGIMEVYGKKFKVDFKAAHGYAGGTAAVSSSSVIKDITDISGIVLSWASLAMSFCTNVLKYVPGEITGTFSGIGRGITFALGVFKAGAGFVIASLISAYLKQFNNLLGAISWASQPVDPPIDHDLPHNTTANVSATADLTGTTLSGTVYSSHLSMDGSTGVSGGWASGINRSFSYDSVASSSASVYDDTGSLVGTGAVNAQAISQYAIIDGHAAYNFTGKGMVSVHATSAPGVAPTADLDPYTGSATRTTGSVTVHLVDANVTIGTSTYLGACTIVSNSITIEGDGAVGFGHHATSVEIPSSGSNLTIGDYTGSLTLGTSTLGSGGSLSFTNFRGKVTVSAHNSTADKMVVSGVVSRVMYLGLNRTSVTLAGPHESFKVQASIHSNADDDYVLKAHVPWGTLNESLAGSQLGNVPLADIIANESWGVDVRSDGSIEVVPMPGTAPGTYHVTISTWSKSVTSLRDENVVEVIIPRYDALAYNVRSADYDEHTIEIGNEGNVVRNLMIETSYSKSSWVSLSRVNITALPGRTYDTGLYVIPSFTVAWPSGTQTIWVNITDVDTSTVIKTIPVNFTYPNPTISNMVITGPAYSSGGAVANYDVNVTNSGNETAIIEFQVTPPPGWAVWSPTSLTIPVGQKGNITLTVTQVDSAWDPGVHTFKVTANPIMKPNNAISANTTMTVARKYAGAVNVTVGPETADYPGSKYNVSIENGGIYSDNFTFSADGLPGSWFTFTPSGANLAVDGTVNFTIQVHPDTPTYSPGPLNFTFYISSENDPSVVTEVFVNFTMPDLYGFRGTSDRPEVYLSPNGNVTFRLLLESLANVNDSVAISHTGPTGWSIAYSSPASMPFGMAVDQNVTITASGGTVGNYYWVNLTITSTGDANRTTLVSVRVLVISQEKVDLANAAAEAAGLADLAYYLDAASALADLADHIVDFMLDETNSTLKDQVLADLALVVTETADIDASVSTAIDSARSALANETDPSKYDAIYANLTSALGSLNDILRPLSLWVPTLRARLLELAEEANTTAYAVNSTYEFGLHGRLRYVWATAMWYRANPHDDAMKGIMGSWIEASGSSISGNFAAWSFIRSQGDIVEVAGSNIPSTTAWPLIHYLEDATAAIRATRLALPPVATVRSTLVAAVKVAGPEAFNATLIGFNIGNWEVYDDTYQISRQLDDLEEGWQSYGHFDAQSQATRDTLGFYVGSLRGRLFSNFTGIAAAYPSLNSSLDHLAGAIPVHTGYDLEGDLLALAENMTLLSDIYQVIADNGISMTLFPPANIVVAGNRTIYRVTLENLAEGDNNVTLSFVGLEYSWLDRTDWNFTLSAGEVLEIWFNATAPSDATAGMVYFSLTGVPNEAIAQVTKDGILVVVVDIGTTVDPYLVKDAIEKGIVWLRETQNWDGSWSRGDGHTSAHSVGLTSLAIWAMMNHGVPTWDPSVKMGLDYIMDNVRQKDNTIWSISQMYETALAVIALAETHNETYDEQINATVKTLLDAQKYYNLQNMWRYSIDSTDYDLSVAGWVMMALGTVEWDMPDQVWWWVTDKLNISQRVDGGFGYTTYSGSTRTMTGSGTLGLLLAGLPPDDIRVRAGLGWLSTHQQTSTSWAGYSFLYHTRAFHAAQMPTPWFDIVTNYLLSTQHADGHWLLTSEYSSMSTAEALLCLEYNIGEYSSAKIFKRTLVELTPRNNTIPRGTEGYFNVILDNKGGRDTINLIVEGIPDSWVDFDTTAVYVPSHTTKVVQMRVAPPLNAALGDYTVTIIAQSATLATSIYLASANLTVIDTLSVTLDVEPTTAQGGQGVPTQYLATVVNTGILSDRYVLEVEAWWLPGGTHNTFNPNLEWRPTDYEFRLPITVRAGYYDREGELIELTVNLTQKLLEGAAVGTVNVSRMRLIQYDASGVPIGEIPLNVTKGVGFDPRTAAVVDINFTIPGEFLANGVRWYALNFDLFDVKYNQTALADRAGTEGIIPGLTLDPWTPNPTDDITVSWTPMGAGLADDPELQYSMDGAIWQSTEMDYEFQDDFEGSGPIIGDTWLKTDTGMTDVDIERIDGAMVFNGTHPHLNGWRYLTATLNQTLDGSFEVSADIRFADGLYRERYAYFYMRLDDGNGQYVDMYTYGWDRYYRMQNNHVYNWLYSPVMYYDGFERDLYHTWSMRYDAVTRTLEGYIDGVMVGKFEYLVLNDVTVNLMYQTYYYAKTVDIRVDNFHTTPIATVPATSLETDLKLQITYKDRGGISGKTVIQTVFVDATAPVPSVPAPQGMGYPGKPTTVVTHIADDHSLAGDVLRYTAPDGSTGTVPLGVDTDEDFDKTLLWLRGGSAPLPYLQATDWTFDSMYTSHLDSYKVLRDLDSYGVVMMSEVYPTSFGMKNPSAMDELMDWVANGGSLYVIYPPNAATMSDFFGVAYNYDLGNGMVVAEPDHPIMNYPYAAVTSGWPQTYEVSGYWTDYADDGFVPILTHPDVPSGAVTMVKHHGKGLIVMDSSYASYTRYLDTGSWLIENTLSFIQRNRVQQLASSSTAPAVQSTDHAMEDYFDNIFTYRYPGATAISVHISQMDMEDGYDFIQVLDGKGRLHETFTGATTDLWTTVVPGDTIHLRAITDGSIRSWGFETDLLRHYGQWIAEIPAMGVTGTVTYTIIATDGAGNTGTSPTYSLELTEPPVVLNITTSPDHPSSSDAITVSAEVMDTVVRDDTRDEWEAGTMVNISIDETSGLHLSGTVNATDRYFAGDDAGRIFMLELDSDMQVTDSKHIATLGSYVRSLVAADFDEDGDIDLVVMNRTDGYLYFFEQTSDWNFSAPVSTGADIGATGKNPVGFALGDFNEDGHMDIVGGGYQTTIRLFAGNGNGTFEVSVLGTISANLVAIASGDMDNDGHLDMVVAGYSGAFVSFMGHGNGTFAIKTMAPMTGIVSGYKAVNLADVDGDGNVDILFNTGSVYLHRGQGDGENFTYGGKILYPGYTGEMELLDLDGDGDLDLFLAKYNGYGVRTYENTGIWRHVPIFVERESFTVSPSYMFGLTRSQTTIGTTGSVTSPVHDMGGSVDWKYVQLDRTSINGQTLDLEVRTSTDNSAWTTWAEVFPGGTPGGQSLLTASFPNGPTARYVQWRITFEDAGALDTPSVRSVNLLGVATDPSVDILWKRADASHLAPWSSATMSKVSAGKFTGSVPAAPVGPTGHIMLMVSARRSGGVVGEATALTYRDATGPVLMWTRALPYYSNTSTSVRVVADLEDTSGVAGATLFYTFDNTTWANVSMTLGHDLSTATTPRRWRSAWTPVVPSTYWMVTSLPTGR